MEAKLRLLQTATRQMQHSFPYQSSDRPESALSCLLWLSVSSSILRPVLRISSLVTLDISSNFIQGEIPGDGFVSLTSFISLDMSDNSFNGSITPELFSLKTLQRLDLSRNVIGGTLSGDIKELKNFIVLQGSLAKLRTLTLWPNMFSGSKPLSVSQLTTLETFDLQNNSLSFEMRS